MLERGASSSFFIGTVVVYCASIDFGETGLKHAAVSPNVSLNQNGCWKFGDPLLLGFSSAEDSILQLEKVRVLVSVFG